MCDASAGLVWWVDLLRGDVMSVDPAGGEVARTSTGAVSACVVPRTGGGLALATERGFTLLDPDGSTEVLPDVCSHSCAFGGPALDQLFITTSAEGLERPANVAAPVDVAVDVVLAHSLSQMGAAAQDERAERLISAVRSCL